MKEPKLLDRQKLVFVANLFLTLGVLAANHPYCYWTGAVGTSVDDAGNWKDESGNVLTAAPGSDAYVVFTNISSALTVTKSGNYDFYGYIARSCTADVKLGGNKHINISEGGVTQESMSGTFWLNFTTVARNATNVINVVEPDATVTVQNGFNAVTTHPDEVVVKRGAGTFLTVNTPGSSVASDHSEFVLEGGVWKVRSKYPSLIGTRLTFNGDNCYFDFGSDYGLTNVILRETEKVVTDEHGFKGNGSLLFGGDDLADTTFGGRFCESISVDWAPGGASPKKLTLVRAVHPTTGRLSVSSGEVALQDGARFTSLGGLSVADGAVLSMATGTDLFVSDLTVSTTGRLKLAEGVMMVADRVTVGETVYTSGVLTKETCNWIEGEGSVALGFKRVTWTGGGETTSIADPENWGGVTLDFAAGRQVVTFPAGATATVPSEDGPFRVKGVVFGGKGVSLGGAGELTVGDEGLVVQGSDASATVGCPIALGAAEVSFDVEEGDELTFVSYGVSGGAGFAAANLSLTGAGMVIFDDGAEPHNLGTMKICAGATAKIGPAAGACVTSLKTVLEASGTLIVCREYRPGDGFTWNGLVKLVRGTFGGTSGGKNVVIDGKTADLDVEGADNKEFYIYGNNSRTIRNYWEAADAVGSMTFTAYTQSSPTLTIKGTQYTRFSAKLRNTGGGALVGEWSPTSFSELTMVKTTYDNAKGGIKLSSGALRFAEGAGISKGTVTAAAGTVLAFDVTAGAMGADAKIEVADGGILTLDEGCVQDMASGALKVSEETIADGRYLAAASADDWLTGEGILQIGTQGGEEVEAVWTGAAQTTSIMDADNWNGAVPDFSACTVVATFPAGAQVSVPTVGTYRFRGIRLAAGDAPSEFTLTGGQVNLGSGGFVVTGEGATVTIDCPVAFEANQTVDCGTNVLVLTANAVLASRSQAEMVTFIGAGSVELHASSPKLGNVTASGAIHVYADNALGGAQARFHQKGNEAGDILVLHGCSLDCAIEINGGLNIPHLEAREGVQYLNGEVTATALNIEQFKCSSGAELHFKGGVKYASTNNGASWSPVSSYTVHVDDKPVISTRIALGGVDADDEGAFYLNVASNLFPRGLVFRNAKAKSNVLYTTVPYALYPDGASGVTFGETARNAVWDLCGCDQGVGVFFSRTTDAVVTSETPATLHLVDNELNYVKTSELAATLLKVSLLGTASQVDRTCFAGAVGFSKEGSYTHYMMGESTSTGAVFVTKGRLIFTRASSTPITLPQEQELTNAGDENTAYTFTPLTGSWRKAHSVVVSGGVLQLQHGAVFSKATDVAVSGAGKIELDAGVTQRCHALSVEGAVYTSGTWGATGSGAEHVDDDHFAGTGRLQIVGEGLGVIIVVR